MSDVPTTAISEPIKRPAGRGSALSPIEREEVRTMYVFDGLSISEISRRTGRTREAISGVVRDEDTAKLIDEARAFQREQAKQRLAAHVETAASAWTDSLTIAAKKGDHKPARDLLMHEGVIQPVRDGGGQVLVQIGVKDSDITINLGDTNLSD